MNVQNQNKGNPVRGTRVLTETEMDYYADDPEYCFNAVLKRCMEEQGISVSQFAYDIGCNESSVYEWLAGVRPKKTGRMRKIAKYLGLKNRDELEYGSSPADLEAQKLLEAEREKNKKLELENALLQMDIVTYLEKLNNQKAG